MPRLRWFPLLLPVLLALGLASPATAGSRSLNCSTHGASVTDSVLGLLLANVDTLTVSNLQAGDTLRFVTTRTGITSSDHEISTPAGTAPLSDAFTLATPGQTRTSNFVMSSSGQKIFTVEITGILALTRSADWTATCLRVLQPSPTGGTPQATTVSTVFATALEVTVTDSGGNPVSGVVVTFATPSSGATATLSSPTATTNASGRASVSATANTIAGSYAVTASVPGGATTASFSLSNTAGAAATISATGGTPQTTTVSAAFTTGLQATVTDAGGNPVSGAVVSFTAPGAGASANLSSPTATTDVNGRASVTAAANASAGSYAVAATVGGVAIPATFTLTNTASTATAIAATDGTPQTTSVSTPFGATLEATVTDSGGNPVSGAVVSFTAPASGASAVLTSLTATTDTFGRATVGATANATAGSYSVTASVAGVATPTTFSLNNTAGAPASVIASAGTPQSATISTGFATALEATVTDAAGNRVSGAVVTFAAPGSGASVGFSSPMATTDASGHASVTATANATAGSYAVTASVAGVATSATFVLSNTASTADNIAATGGTPQTAVVSTQFGTQIEVTVTDSGGNPVGGVVVTFTAPTSGASATLSSATATTNASGQASVSATANTTAGSYSLTASVPGAITPASFSLTNTAGAAAGISATGGTPQSTTVSLAFATALEATVSDTAGNPVSGVVVNFSSPGTGASATLSGPTGTTDASGRASVTATANATAGSYTVTATVAGVGSSATFTLTNAASAPASIQATGGTPQNTPVTSPFPTALEVTVTDANGNPASGAVVTFSAPGAGAGAILSSTTATTNASGRASVLATANAITGAFTVSASTAGVGTQASFSLSNTASVPTDVAATGGALQSAIVLTAFAAALEVTVTDTGGNPVSGVVVSFTSPSSGAAATLSAPTAATDAFGRASVTATANAMAGAYTVTASVAGVAMQASFDLTNTVSAPASVSATGGTPQSSVVSTGFGAALEATVTDSGGNPVSGAVVSFTVPAAGAGAGAALSSPTAITDSSGRARVSATANGVTGAYLVEATVAGVGSQASFSLSNTATGGWALSISALPDRFSTPDQRIDFEFVVTNTGSADITAISVAGTLPGLISCPSTSLPSGGSTTCTSNYRTTEADVAAGLLVASATVSGTPASGTLASAAATVTVLLDRAAVTANTRKVIGSFVTRRAEAISSFTPDEARGLHRLQRAGQVDPAQLSASEDASHVAFAGSLLAGDPGVPARTEGGHLKGDVRTGGQRALDIWFAGQTARFEAADDFQGSAAQWAIGADYLLDPSLLLGVLARFDRVAENDPTSSVKGYGWLIGPYLDVRLGESVFFHAHGAWGQSENEVDPLGFYTDAFETERWLARASLSGIWQDGAWAVQPVAAWSYFSDRQKAYVDGLENLIPEDTFSVHRVSIGPTLSFRGEITDSMSIEPMAMVNGVYSIRNGSGAFVDARTLDGSELRLRIEGGVTLGSPDFMARASAFYEGSGAADSFSIQGAEVSVTIPLR